MGEKANGDVNMPVCAITTGMNICEAHSEIVDQLHISQSLSCVGTAMVVE